jgi:hypothetical protein
MKKLMILIFGLTLMVNVNAQVRNLEYHPKQDIRIEKEEQKNALELYPDAPGTLLIKARDNIIGGFVLQTIAAFGLIENTNERNSGAVNMICVVSGLVGLGLELNGVFKIGKAGISLNKNGIGIKVKF